MPTYTCLRCKEPHLDADTIRARLLGVADDSQPEGGHLCLRCAAEVWDELEKRVEERSILVDGPFVDLPVKVLA